MVFIKVGDVRSVVFRNMGTLDVPVVRRSSQWVFVTCVVDRHYYPSGNKTVQTTQYMKDTYNALRDAGYTVQWVKGGPFVNCPYSILVECPDCVCAIPETDRLHKTYGVRYVDNIPEPNTVDKAKEVQSKIAANDDEIRKLQEQKQVLAEQLYTSTIAA